MHLLALVLIFAFVAVTAMASATVGADGRRQQQLVPVRIKSRPRDDRA